MNGLFSYIELRDERDAMVGTGNLGRAHGLNDEYFGLLFEEYTELLELRRNLAVDNERASIAECDELIQSIFGEMGRVYRIGKNLNFQDTNTREDK